MNWNEIFDYDETSPTFLRWKDKYRLGKGGKPVRRTKDAQAGSPSVDGRPTLSYGGKLYSVNQIVGVS